MAKSKTATDDLLLTDIRRCKLAWINAVDRLDKEGRGFVSPVGFEYLWNKYFSDAIGYKFIHGSFIKIKS